MGCQVNFISSFTTFFEPFSTHICTKLTLFRGPYLQGIKAVIAQSFERIHRSNLVGMGILPLEFKAGENADSLGLDGFEQFNINFDGDSLDVNQNIEVTTSTGKTFQTKSRLDTAIEIEYFRNGGILHYVLRNMANSN